MASFRVGKMDECQSGHVPIRPKMMAFAHEYISIVFKSLDVTGTVGSDIMSVST